MRVLRIVGHLLLYVYVIGAILSGVYFNWQFAKENGFLKWILLGELIPTLKASIWPYYLVNHYLIAESNVSEVQDDNNFGSRSLDSSTLETTWWKAEYEALGSAVDSANGKLVCSFRTGPAGADSIVISLLRGSEKSLILILQLPSGAIKTANPNDPTEVEYTITMRDHNFDGKPDDVLVSPEVEFVFKESITTDGFVKLRDSKDHESFFSEWSIGVAFATNHFLHQNDSVSPPGK